MSSTSMTKNGKPLLEWSVDTLAGVVSETKRNDDTQISVTTEKQIDPKSLGRDAAKISSNGQFQELSDEKLGDDKKIRNFEELDAQRDIAFKVMYFFIVFIIGTFGLLFAYF